jgi:hypothetical protein
VTGYKINSNTSIPFLYTNNKHAAKEIGQTTPFTIATNTIKDLIKDLGVSHQSEWLRSKIQVTADAGEDVEKEEHSSLLVGLQAYTTTLEISLAVPQKIGHST